jgi:hypothetical protein
VVVLYYYVGAEEEGLGLPWPRFLMKEQAAHHHHKKTKKEG